MPVFAPTVVEVPRREREGWEQMRLGWGRREENDAEWRGVRRVLLIVSLTRVVLQTDLRSTPQGTLSSGGRLPATLRLTVAVIFTPLYPRLGLASTSFFFYLNKNIFFSAISARKSCCGQLTKLWLATFSIAPSNISTAGIQSSHLTSWEAFTCNIFHR